MSTHPATRQSFIERFKPKFTGEILVLSEVSPLGNWLEDVLGKYQLNFKLTNQLSGAITTFHSADMIIVDEKLGLESLTELMSLSQSNQQQFVFLAWVGFELPDSLQDKVAMLFKPITERKVLDLFTDNQQTKVTAEVTTHSSNLLLVDDNTINLKAMQSQLEHAGFQVTTATNGLQAVCACREQHFDLVLMDVQMPEMDGLEATKQIKLEQGSHAPPIIGISAHVMEEHINKAYDAGMIDYLCKPIKEVDLLNTVHNKLSH